MSNLKYVLILVTVLATFRSFARASSELDDSDFATTMASVFKVSEDNVYQNNLVMREARKIGLAFGVGGAFGLYGLNVEVNFEDQNAGFAGLGSGSNYNSFNIGWKHSFEGDTIAPYTSVGYSRWYSSSNSGDYRNSAVLDRVLSTQEKAEHQFAADFLFGAVGLQYLQLKGPMSGTSLYAEIILLDDVGSGTLVPTGAVGAGYYF